MSLTINNLDLSKKNTLNITSVENEYDAAMRSEADQEKADPVTYYANDINAYFWRKGYADREEARWSVGYAKRNLTAEQFCDMIEKLKPGCLDWINA